MNTTNANTITNNANGNTITNSNNNANTNALSKTSTAIVEVVLLEAINLASKSKSADVYVRMKVGDGFFHWSKTNTAKTTRPKWNFVTVLKVRTKQSKVLHLRVNEVNFFAPDETLGECHLNLEELSPNETHDLCLPLQPTHSNGVLTSRGELHFLVSYHPNGKSVPPTEECKKETIPLQLLDQFRNPGESDSNQSRPSDGDVAAPSVSSVKAPEQLQAEQLYNKAMEEMGRFVEYAREAKKSKNATSENADDNPDNTLAPAALKLASQLLFESIKLQRSGKSYAMLAFIFFQFDSLELTSKYLSYAAQLDEALPVVTMLRGLLVTRGCDRPALDQTKPHDRLSIVVVSAKHLSSTTPIFCRLVVGYAETLKDTAISSFLQHSNEPGSILWEVFFEVPLTKATERYHYGHQNLILQLYTKADEVVTLVGESHCIDLFSVDRDTVHDLWVPLTDGHGSIRIVFNYQMGFLSEEEILPLLYTSLICCDNVMVNSLMKRKPNLDGAFRDTNSNTTPSEVEPKHSTLMTKAARYGNTRLLKKLIALGASVNATDPDGFTPIMRAVQFDGIHDNMNAVRYLYSSGADLAIENQKSFDIFAYCQSIEMQLFLKERTQMLMYMLAVVICPNCKYLHFPVCTEAAKKSLQGRNCTCSIGPCKNCSHTLLEEHRQKWLVSEREMKYASTAFTPSLPDCIDHYLLQCPKCLSFGFPGTYTPAGSQLVTATDTAVVGTINNSFEKTEISLKDAETMWTLLYHGTGCPLYSPTYRLVRALVSRAEVTSLLSLAPHSASFWDRTPAERLPATELHSSMPSEYSLEVLPIEILQHIVTYLCNADIITMSKVSHRLQETCGDQLWKYMVKRDFRYFGSELEDTQQSDRKTWKETYLFYTRLYKWVRELLFEENFYPRCIYKIADNRQVQVQFRLNGKKYLFNMDGTPFTFEEEFVMELYFSAPGVITGLNLIAQDQSIENAIKLCGVLALSPSSTTNIATLMHELNNAPSTNNKVTLTLVMEQSAIKRWVAPYVALGVPGFYAFLMLKDNVAGSVILDIFYYNLLSAVLK